MKSIINKIFGLVGLRISIIEKSPNVGHSKNEKLVSNFIGGTKFLMNASHIHNSKFLFDGYSKNLIRITKATMEKYKNATIIDVGANIGDSVGLIRTVTDAQIICIEGDLFYFHLLKKNLENFKNIVSIHQYLGESNDILHVKPIHEHGTLKLSNDSSGDNKIKINTLDSLINEIQFDWNNVKLLKIDTDGFDNSIIKGSEELLKKLKPVIFFEYSESHLKENGINGLDIFPFLDQLDYENIMFYEPNGRFIFSTKINNYSLIEQMHDFISNFGSPIQYLDLVVFHKDDIDLFEKLLLEEKALNKSTVNKMVFNRQ